MSGGISPDVWIAAGAGLFVALFFVLALQVPRKVRPARSTDVKLDDLKARLDEVEVKQNKADHDIRNVRMVVAGLATKDSVQAVALQVAEMRGEVKGLVANTNATTRAVERIEGFLMTSTAEVIAAAKTTEAKT